jgi:hypothetical protein
MRAHHLQIHGLVAVGIQVVEAQVETGKVATMHLAYGTDEERLDNDGEFESYEECLAEALKELDVETGDIIHIAEVVPYVPKISATRIIEDINEDAWDKCGESVDSWPELTKIEEDELQVRVQKVVMDYLEEIKELPRFYTCKNGKQFEVKQGDLAWHP